MHSNGGIEVGVLHAHNAGRSTASREAGDVDASWVDRVVAHNLSRDPGDEGGLALIPALVPAG